MTTRRLSANAPVNHGIDASAELMLVTLITKLGDRALHSLHCPTSLKMPKTTMIRMLGNVGFDWAIGLVPVVGDAADFLFKSNSRNLKLIKRHLDRHHPGTSTIDHR